MVGDADSRVEESMEEFGEVGDRQESGNNGGMDDCEEIEESGERDEVEVVMDDVDTETDSELVSFEHVTIVDPEENEKEEGNGLGGERVIVEAEEVEWTGVKRGVVEFGRFQKSGCVPRKGASNGLFVGEETGLIIGNIEANFFR